MERSKASVVTATMRNHEKESDTYDMIDIMKLERRIKNLENINSGKVPIFRTK